MKSRYELMSEPVKQLMKDFKARKIAASQISTVLWYYAFKKMENFPWNIIL